MTFRDLFEGMHRKDPLISGGALAGSDGLAVEEWKAESAERDLGALCAEMAQFFKESGRISSETGLGTARELFVAGESGLIFVRRVTDEYFLLLLAAPEAIQGKCRFLLRQCARQALEML
ncbi:MAG: roadblock/LC7 domain-containing protein [Deltaproteobacteria bacterium]